MDKTKKRFLSVKEAAEYLGLSPRTIYNGLTRNTEKPFPVKHKKLGKLIKFEIQDLNEYADSIPYHKSN